MNKAILYAGLGVGAAALGYMAYRFMQVPTQQIQTTSVNPNSNQKVGNFQVDQNSYPFQANQPPRVDNSNQPWANNNRAAIGSMSNMQMDVNLSNTAMIAQFAKSGAEIAKGLTSIWDDLGVNDWFSDEDPTGFASTDDFSDWDSAEQWDANSFSWDV